MVIQIKEENNFSNLSLKLKKNFVLLKKIDEVLFRIHESDFKLNSSEDISILKELLNTILVKVTDKGIQEFLLNRNTFISYLKEKNPNWDKFLKDLNDLYLILSSHEIILTKDYFKILDDIANAIQKEGNEVYKKSKVFL